MTASEKLTIAIAAIAMLIAAGQLVIMLKSAQTSKKRVKTRWARSVFLSMINAVIALVLGGGHAHRFFLLSS